jgi:hypothetical protein
MCGATYVTEDELRQCRSSDFERDWPGEKLNWGVQARDYGRFIDDFCWSVPNGPNMGQIHSRHLLEMMITR